MSWAEDYTRLLHSVHSRGHIRNSRDGLTREFTVFSDSFDNPHFQVIPGRGGSAQFAYIEQLCYLSGEPPEILAQNFPRFRRYQERSGLWYGAYGPRLRTRLRDVVKELDQRRDSRRGLAMIYEAWDTTMATFGDPPKDIPCTICLNFWVHEDGLECHAFMRSTDLWYGLYYDIPAFHAIQHMLARALDLPVGKLSFTTTSLHLYKRHWDRIPPIHAGQAGPPLALPPCLVGELRSGSAVERLEEMREGCLKNLQEFTVAGASFEGERASIEQSS